MEVISIDKDYDSYLYEHCSMLFLKKEEHGILNLDFTKGHHSLSEGRGRVIFPASLSPEEIRKLVVMAVVENYFTQDDTGRLGVEVSEIKEWGRREEIEEQFYIDSSGSFQNFKISGKKISFLFTTKIGGA